MTDANYTLTTANGAADESRKMMLNISGTLTAARNVICPTASKLYFVKNATTGGYAITLKTAAGTGVSIPNGAIAVLMCDGTNVNPATNALIGENSATGTAAGTVRVTGGANSSTGAGGPINITGGAAASGGAGGGVVVNGGTSSTGVGGGVTITGGVTATTGSSGPISITGGAAGIGNTPGAVSITGGAGASSGAATAGGLVTITGGASGNFGSGLAGGGAINITGGAGNTLLASGTPGAIVISGGTAGITGQSGASVSVTASSAFAGATNANGGNLTIQSGAGAFTGGIHGVVAINAPGTGGAGGAYVTVSTAGTERMRVISNGEVLVGTAVSLGGKLNIASTAGVTSIVTTNGTVNSVLGGGDGSTYSTFGTTSNVPLVVATNNAERMRVDAAGNVIIGSTTPNVASTRKLSVLTTGTNVSGSFAGDSGATQVVEAWNKATTGDNLFVLFATEAAFTTRGSISYNRAGGLTAYNTTSDYRAKDLLGAVSNAGATVDSLKVYEGRMKGATQSRPMLVAHEAQEVAPYLVMGAKDAIDGDGNPIYQQIDVSALVPLLIVEIQSLRVRLAALEVL
jgi:hypothetical protein